MRFTLASALLVIAAATATSATDYGVTVGADGQLAYSPTSVTAEAGDTVTFTFFPKNHTVTQSNFTTPCIQLEGGIDSGFEPVSSNATQNVTFTVTVNDTNPTWWYCHQTGHCQKGMVFAINPTANETFDEFQATANASAANGAPSSNSSSPSGTTSKSPSSTGTSPSSTKSSTSSSAAMRMGGQAGSLIAAVVFVGGVLI